MYENEEWVPAIGHEDKYEVSNYGRVRRIDLNPTNPRGRPNKMYGHIFEPTKANNGYMRISIGMDRDYVHRIVAKHFLPNPDNLPVVNHIDGNKQNNYVGNLEWCTQKHNAEHASRTGLINRDSEERKIAAVKNLSIAQEKACKPVLQLNAVGEIVQEYESAKAAEFALSGKNGSHVAEVASGKSNHHSAFGYQWVYKEDFDPTKDYSYRCKHCRSDFHLK